MEQQLYDYVQQTYQSILTLLSSYHPVEYDTAGVSFTWEAATVIAALSFIGIVTTYVKHRHERKELRALKDLLCARKRLATQLEALYTHAFANELVKGRLKARHKDRLTNGHDKPKMPNETEQISQAETYFRALRV